MGVAFSIYGFLEIATLFHHKDCTVALQQELLIHQTFSPKTRKAMPPKNSTKGLKMSLGDFMGGAPADELGALPTGPRQRGPDDDGSFQRRPRREDGNDREMSRADQDGSWRKGGGGGGGGGGFRDDRGGSSGFGDRGGQDRSGGYRDDRRGGGFDRGGYRGGGNDRGNDRSGYDRDGGYEKRSGGFDRDGGGGGGSRFDRGDRGGFDRGGPREGGFDRGGPRDGGFDRSGPSSTGERPRLQLKSRTAPVPSSTNEQSPKVSASPRKSGENLPKQQVKAEISKEEKPKVQEPETLVSADNIDADKRDKESKVEDPDKKKREPAVVNSRAALLGDAPDPKRDANTRRDRGDRSDRGPPPVVNKRFADLAEEEREKNKERETRRGPPPVANSRFASVAETDRREREESGPPPIANSRFAAAAEADRSTYRERNDRGPPPVANSRFAAAAEADRSNDDHRRNERGPPPTTNSRFAAAAALAEQEREREGFGRERGGFGRNDDRGGPVPQNSRFAKAVEADGDYVEPSQRNFGGGDRGRFDDRDRGDRFNRRGRDDYERPGRGGVDRNQESEQDSGPAQPEPSKNSVADLLKPKARPLEENILRVPTKEHADNILKPPTKENVSDTVATTPKKEKLEAATPAPQDAVQPTPIVDDSAVIAEFISGKRLGEELKAWVGEQVISSVEKLVFAFLEENQKMTPDISCQWAEPSNYGAALVSLVEDDLLKQVDVLFAIQKYCNKIGMPKFNDEYVIQAMFRSMYKYDLASDDAFEFWKEDESEEHEAGKVNAVIQTVDWFNWLEQDEEEEEDDAEYEE